jgi:hypothetical protein
LTLTEDQQLQAVRANSHMMIDFFARGHLIPFLGAGVNLADRPDGATFRQREYLPNAAELSKNIADRFHYPSEWGDRDNLMRVSWHASANVGDGVLYEYLHDIFNQEYPLTSVHTFFAELPGKLRKKGYPTQPRLIITTNYDRLMERAFEKVNEPYDVLSYVAHKDISEDEVGKFRYKEYGKESRVLIDRDDFKLSDRAVILKIHGAVHDPWNRSSFVITEDHYLEYLARMVESSQIPSVLMEEMLYKRFLFLGYSLSDWNLRVLLNIITERRPFNDWSWAIMDNPKAWDADYWTEHKVRLTKWSLNDYIRLLTEWLEALPNNGEGS